MSTDVYNMDKLPPELLLEIFAHLELEDLFSATGVCVMWHRAASHMLATKQRTLIIRDGASVIDVSDLTIEATAVINKSDLMEPLKEFVRNLKHLFIVYDDDNESHKFDRCESLDAVLKSAVNLISLNLIGSVRCTRRLITTIIQHCPDSIETVSLSVRNKSCYTRDDECETSESLRLIKTQLYGENLREMKITIAEPTTSKMYAFYNNASLPAIYSGKTMHKHLCEIYLLNCCGLDARAYNAIGLALNLKTVRLKHAYSLDMSGVRAISKLPCLRALSISDAVRVIEDGWKYVFTGCTSVTMLKLKNCTQLSDSVFCCDSDVVCNNLQHLTLDLENCKQVTDAGVNSLLTACVRLVSLTLCVDYDEATVDTICRGVTKQLQRLSSLTVTVQTALAVPKKPFCENLSQRCSFVVKSTKIVFP